MNPIVTIDPNVMHGSPCFAGTRVEVATFFDHLEAGLELKLKGHDVRGFATGVAGPISPETKRELLVAIIPLGGTLSESDKVRVVLSGFGIFASNVEGSP